MKPKSLHGHTNDTASLRERASRHSWATSFCPSYNPPASQVPTPRHLLKADAMAKAAFLRARSAICTVFCGKPCNRLCGGRCLPATLPTRLGRLEVERSRMRALDPSETAALLDALKSSCLFMPVLLAITTGMRGGEITAMRWRAVDLVNAQLAVIVSAEQTASGVREKETKSGRARTGSLTGLALEELRRHKAKQAEEWLRLGIRQTDDMHVVAQIDGQALMPQSLTHEFSRFIASKTLPPVRFHDLRHTHATQLPESGVHP